MDTMALFQRRFLQAALATAAALVALPAQSAPPLTVSTDPLGSSTTSINPNVMLILDDSGSMASDFLPDYVVDDNGTGSTRIPASTAIRRSRAPISTASITTPTSSTVPGPTPTAPT